MIKARRTRCASFIPFTYSRRLKQILAEPWDMIHAWEEPYIVAGHQIARWAQRGVPLVYRTGRRLHKKYPPPFNWIEQYDMVGALGWICSGSLVARCRRHGKFTRKNPCD